ncbi:hypothetical protein CSOJ01_13213 [Colletotrichum sojae]|uniref:Uncharacterized protein n=1 Tax=Colletotrichum sojae TaxID=2175907 RepID=A0A8H6ITB1_9PEZI|nr:hypothetical protein CSOJ01_13213 [Colletotrichum sojae]
MASPMIQSPHLPGAGHQQTHVAPSQNGYTPSGATSNSNSASPALPNIKWTPAVTASDVSASDVSASASPPVPLVTSDIPAAQLNAQAKAPSPAETPKVIHGFVPSFADKAKEANFALDYENLSNLIRSADPDAVRRAVRDHHEKTLLGSHYHMAFLMNVAMHRSDTVTLQRACRDFGHRLIADAKVELMGLMKRADFDAVADVIISKASTSFLDKALAARLPTIEARHLVNALARAERLGYDADDVVENEHVIPTAAPNPAPPPPRPTAPAKTPASSQYVKWNGPGPRPPSGFTEIIKPPAQPPVPYAQEPWPDNFPEEQKPQCTWCKHVFRWQSAWAHHMKKKVCLRMSGNVTPVDHRFSCPHCVQPFSGHSGLSYHLLNKVCGDFGEVDRNYLEKIKTLPPIKRPASDGTPTHGSVFLNSTNSGSPAPGPMATPLRTQQQPAQPSPSTPTLNGEVPLGTPRPKDMSHLTEAQVEALLSELRRAELDFKAKIDAVHGSGLDETEAQKKLTSLRNSFACKQSTIRKKYGIKLRERRNRAMMDAERERMGYGGAPRISTPRADQHADKRARINANGDAALTQSSRPEAPPVKQVAVSDMGGGLTGSNATAAMEDPTMSMSQPTRPTQAAEATRPPPSTYQQANHRVELHEPSAPRRFTSSAPANTSDAASGSGTIEPEPGVIYTAEELLQKMGRDTRIVQTTSSDSESDSDSDSDSDSSTDDDQPSVVKTERSN